MPKRQVLSIRRFVVGTLVLIWLGINASGVYYLSLEHKLIEETILASAMEHAHSWASRLATELSDGRAASVQETIDAIAGGESVRGVWLTDLKGNVIAQSGIGVERLGRGEHGDSVVANDSVGRLVEQHPRPEGFFHEAGHNFDLMVPVGHDGERLGVLGVAINTSRGNVRAKALAKTGLLTLGVLTVGFALAAFWVDRRLSKGVRQLTQAVRGIASGQLDPRLRVGTGDELDELGDSVNRMADALKQSRERVRHWKGQLEQVVAERTEQLEASQVLLARREKMAALGLMAAGVAHEVGNPLSAISAIIQRVELDAAPQLQQKCRTIREQIERMAKTIDELRQFARPARSRSGAPVNLNEVVRLSLQVCRYDPRGKSVKIVTDLDSDVPAVCGDADRWQQVCLNLAINAFDAMPEGGSLTVTTRSHDGNVELVFTDTGEGMTRDQLSKLFHPFYSTKSPERASGLGLSVCQGILRSYGGTIEVESEPGRGSEFRVIIPAYRGTAALGLASSRGAQDRPALPTSGGSTPDAIHPGENRNQSNAASHTHR